MVFNPMIKRQIILILLAFLLCGVVVAQAQMMSLTGAGGKFKASGGGGGPPPPTYTGPGDIVSGATFWGGLRCYAAANASANAIRIRRASDNTETDVALDASCDLTDVSGTFCAATTCYVKTLYDQSGGAGSDATQTTAGQQPQLVFSCIGTKPCMRFVAANTTFVASNNPGAYVNPVSLSATMKCNGSAATLASVDIGLNLYCAGGDAISGDNGDITVAATDNVWHAVQYVLQKSPTNSNLSADGTTTTNPVSFGAFLNDLHFGVFADGVNGPMDGDATELGAWSAAFSGGNIAAICQNQQAYYGSGNFGSSC